MVEEKIIHPKEHGIPELEIKTADTLEASSFDSLSKLLGKHFIVDSRQKEIKLIGKLETDPDNKNGYLVEGLAFHVDDNGGHSILGEKYIRHAHSKYGIKNIEEFDLRNPRFIYSERVSKKLEEDLEKLQQLSLSTPYEPSRGKKL